MYIDRYLNYFITSMISGGVFRWFGSSKDPIRTGEFCWRLTSWEVGEPKLVVGDAGDCGLMVDFHPKKSRSFWLSHFGYSKGWFCSETRGLSPNARRTNNATTGCCLPPVSKSKVGKSSCFNRKKPTHVGALPFLLYYSIQDDTPFLCQRICDRLRCGDDKLSMHWWGKSCLVVALVYCRIDCLVFSDKATKNTQHFPCILLEL